MTRARRDRGQATAELALTLPVVVVLLLGVVQVVVVAVHQLAVLHAAREGARAAAVSADPATAASLAARAATPLAPLDVVTTVDATTVTVSVTFDDDTDVVLVGGAIPAVTLEAQVTMLLEPP